MYLLSAQDCDKFLVKGQWRRFSVLTKQKQSVTFKKENPLEPTDPSTKKGHSVTKKCKSRWPKPVGGLNFLVPMRWKRTIATQQFLNPRTGKTEDFLLFHGTSTCAVIFPITTENEVVAIRQFKYGIAAATRRISPVIYELPAGGTDDDESSEGAARRELFEETGYRAGKLIRLHRRIFYDPAVLTLAFVPWLAFDCEKAPQEAQDPWEFIEVKTFPLKKWLAMIHRGEILDCRTIAVSLMALPHIKH